MLTIPGVNVVPSDEGFSLEVLGAWEWHIVKARSRCPSTVRFL
jgi:hypothetical protein